MIRVLEERDFPLGDLKLFASERSLGTEIEYGGEPVVVEKLGSAALQAAQLDYCLFACSGDISAEFVPVATASGAIAIDNSSHFRMNDGIPLIVPEVNPQHLSMAERHGIIANPNCSTIQLVVVLHALRQWKPIERVLVSSYQSVSGAGSDAIDELQKQIGQLFQHQSVSPQVFPHQIAFNCIPQIDSFLPSGYTKEEQKIINESRKIMQLPQLDISATAVRVPTLISHAETVTIDFASPVEAAEARGVLEKAEGVIVMDDPLQRVYPLGFSVTGRDEVFVGRIRNDECRPQTLHLWIVADNLRKGAATNAVQIAELCCDRQFEWIPPQHASR
jgi:aspartate-semialdehyde dehydrogenase